MSELGSGLPTGKCDIAPFLMGNHDCEKDQIAGKSACRDCSFRRKVGNCEKNPGLFPGMCKKRKKEKDDEICKGCYFEIKKIKRPAGRRDPKWQKKLQQEIGVSSPKRV